MTHPTIVPLDHAPHREPDYIRVMLSDVRVDLQVGIRSWEQSRTQPVIVHLEVEAALPHRYQDLSESSLSRVINYEIFHEYICNELPRMGHIPLLETIGEHIINRCFEDCRVRTVRVRLEKPEVFRGTARAGIEMVRTRPGASA